MNLYYITYYISTYLFIEKQQHKIALIVFRVKYTVELNGEKPFVHIHIYIYDIQEALSQRSRIKQQQLETEINIQQNI